MGSWTHITAIANKKHSWDITTFVINGENKPSQAMFVSAVKYQIIQELGQI